eukprot:CAMPEP_0184697858 /NCGR_PEP_ID=MMETSP0313-20130426/4663_1 /TAXON_ID=2792 /ORGANISM="Porphyridium aerugineum, Strain SAG 1380-2" /LENGTH=772 /DNA_ID=CAMNT_0027156699 /DNA_START=48 /DNA_END=2366 /DNA_ORIENTATION=-
MEQVQQGLSDLQIRKRPIPQVIPGQRNVLVTSALPYVNNVPHLGNLIGAVLSADVYSRYLRQRHVNCVYICGTDEYGTATETKAQLEGVTPKEICDHYHAIHAKIYEWFDIEFDKFGRTSTDSQTKICQDIFWNVQKNGYLEFGELEQLYCERDDRFLADRFVTGTCPSCGFEDARGDQCEHCSRMLNPNELIRPRCSACGSTPIPRSSKHLFLDLGKLQPALEKWVEKASKKGDWNANCIAMTNSWLRDGLKSRCITRDLKWGTPVPLEGYTDKVFYVWFDAPIGYISITAELTKDWETWWKNPDQVEMVQFMGKDNVPFHTIVFPCTLIATGEPWTFVHHLSTTEYLNYETGKFSKSRGVGVFGNDAQNTGIDVAVWRYYLLINRPEGADAIFVWEDFQAKNNTELLNNVGNFVNRTVNFVVKFFAGKVGKVNMNAEDEKFISDMNVELKAYIEAMDSVQLKNALKRAMAFSQIGNLYIQTMEPWVWVKKDIERAASIVSLAANMVAVLNSMLEPFLGGRFSAKVDAMLGINRDGKHGFDTVNTIPDEFKILLPEGHMIGQPELLFFTIEDSQVQELRQRFSGKQDGSTSINAGKATASNNAGDESLGLDIRVGKIVEIAESPESESLFIGKLDVGEATGPRNFVAGLRGIYTLQELDQRMVAVVCNLQPVRLGGVESQGMLLTAEKKKEIKLLEIPPNSNPGDRIRTSKTQYVEAPLLDRKGFQNASKAYRVNADGHILFNKEQVMGVMHGDTLTPITSGGVGDGGKLK